MQRLIGAANIPLSGFTGSGSGCTAYLLITITRSGISVIRPNQNVAAPNPVFPYAGAVTPATAIPTYTMNQVVKTFFWSYFSKNFAVKYTINMTCNTIANIQTKYAPCPINGLT